MQVNVKARQTPLDIAIREAGTLESLFEVAELNGIGITDDLHSGQLLNAPAAVAPAIADYFKRYKIYPASATTTITDLLPQGVEFWAIEYDFIIS